MERNVPPRAATFVLLDPEGYTLNFTTVRALSKFRTAPRKVELMILVDTGSVFRTGRAEIQGQSGPTRLSWALPFNWRELLEAYESGDLDVDQARTEIAERYRASVRGLGYKHVLARPITRGLRDGAAVYHLVFATDNDAGERIMRMAFDRVYVNEGRRRRADGGPRPGEPIQGRLDLS